MSIKVYEAKVQIQFVRKSKNNHSCILPNLMQKKMFADKFISAQQFIILTQEIFANVPNATRSCIYLIRSLCHLKKDPFWFSDQNFFV